MLLLTLLFLVLNILILNRDTVSPTIDTTAADECCSTQWFNTPEEAQSCVEQVAQIADDCRVSEPWGIPKATNRLMESDDLQSHCCFLPSFFSLAH